jgi:hypothetical protein
MVKLTVLLDGWHDDEWVDPESNRPQEPGTWDFNSPAGRILAAVRAGNFIEAAAEYAGLSAAAVHKWRRRARAALPRNPEFHRKAVPIAERPYVDFDGALAKSQASWEVEAVGRWTRAGSEDWRAARDMLARRSSRWSETVNHQVSGPGGGPIPMATLEITRQIAQDPEARELASALLARIAGSSPPSSFDDAGDLSDRDREEDEDDEDGTPVLAPTNGEVAKP